MKEWIKNLKVGDMVFVCGRWGASLHKVEKITPAGNIKVNGLLYNSFGIERGGDTWSKLSLREATPEEIKSYNEKLIIKRAINLMHETKQISYEKAKAIISLLTDTTEKEREVKDEN